MFLGKVKFLSHEYRYTTRSRDFAYVVGVKTVKHVVYQRYIVNFKDDFSTGNLRYFQYLMFTLLNFLKIYYKD